MTAPTGMSTTNTLDTNYCMRITGYTDTASALAGPRTATNPSATVSAGTFYYLSGGAFLNKATTDVTLDTLAVSCSKTQTVSGQSVTWRVTVTSGGIDRSTTSTTQTTTADTQTRTEAIATVNPIVVVMRYELIVAGTSEVDLTITADLGDLIADGVYGAPPAAG